MKPLHYLPELEITPDRASIRFPFRFYPPPASITECLRRAHRVSSWDLSSQGADQTLHIRAISGTLEDAIREVFADLNGYPFFSMSDTASFRSSTKPLMSCIILLTANDLFVANHLVPSIIRSSKGFDIEILIVYNGLDASLDLFRQFDVSASEFGCVSKGYNQGVHRSKGKYVAIFHDDCVLADSNWIPKCLTLLEDGYLAVSPEIQKMKFIGACEPFVVAKNVPLVMERKHFVALGGYDETYYIGYEDFDLGYQILSSGGAFSRVDLDYVHFSGMSTALMFGDKRALCKRLFAWDVLPLNAISGLRDRALQRLMQNENSKWIQANEFRYFLCKFQRYWNKIGNDGALVMCRQLEGVREADECVLAIKREAMIDFVRQFAGESGR